MNLNLEVDEYYSVTRKDIPSYRGSFDGNRHPEHGALRHLLEGEKLQFLGEKEANLWFKTEAGFERYTPKVFLKEGDFIKVEE